MPAADLFAPLRLGAIPVANRIAMAPLTRSRAGLDGVHTPLAAEYFAQRASAGLLITEATDISPQGHGFVRTPGIFTEAQVAAWHAVTSRVHDAGGHIVVQLMHVGRLSHFSLQENSAAPVAPSAIQAGDFVMSETGPIAPSMPRALRRDELPGVVEQYCHAARMAQLAGFDGVEIHMANAFLLDQFLRDSTNRRDDDYGGSIENRARLPLEVARAVADIWGADRTGARISPVKAAMGATPIDSNPQATFGYLAEQLGQLGLAYLHVIEADIPAGPANLPLDFQAIRRAFHGTYIANGGYDRARALDAIATGRADMIAFGRPFIGNPDLVERLRHNAPLFEAPASAYYGGGAKGYVDFPVLGSAGPA